MICLSENRVSAYGFRQLAALLYVLFGISAGMQQLSYGL